MPVAENQSPPRSLWESGLLKDLIEECPDCKKWNEAVERFNRECRNLTVTAIKYDPDDDSQTEKVIIRTPVKVDCYYCQGTGLQLTNRGKKFLAFIGMFLPQVQPHWIRLNEEIPF